MSLPIGGRIECWDPLAGARREVRTRATAYGVAVALHLARRESVVLAADPRTDFAPCTPAGYAEQRRPLELSWQVYATDGTQVAGLRALAKIKWSKGVADNLLV